MHIRQLKNRISVIAAILLTTAVPPTLALDGLGLVEVNAVWDITNFEVWSAPGQTGIQLTAPCTTVGVGLPTGSNQMDNPTGSDPEFPQSSNPLTENQWRWNGSGAAPCAGRSGQGYVGIVAATQGTVTVVDSAFFQVGTLTHYNIAVPGFPPTDFGNGAYVTLGLTGQYVFHDLTGPTPQNVQLVIDYGIEFNETLNVSSCLYPAADNSNGCADRTVIIGPAVPPTVTIGGSLVSIDVDQFLPLDTNGNCDTTATPASAFFTAEGGSTTGCAFGTVTTGNLQIDKVAVGGDTTFEIRHVELGQIQSDPPGNTQGQEVSTPIVTAVTTAGGAGSTGLLPTTPGFIKVEEVPASIPAGWEFESITCVDPDETFGPIYNANSTPWVNAVSETAALIDLDSVLASNSTLSEDIVCTFVNRKNPTITVTKVGSPSDSQSFDFTATSALNGLLAVDGITPDITDLSDDTLNDGLANGVDGGNAAGSFSLTADGTASSSMTFEVDAGDFTITEQVAAGRELTGLVCTATNFDGDPVTVTTVLATGVATITNLSWGDEVTCTYTNTEQALIVVGKALSPTTDSGIFDLSINGAVVVDEATHGDTNDGLGGNPAPIAVNIGEMITVTEIAGTNAPGTNLGNYNSTLTCSGGGVTDPGGTTSGSFEVPVSASGETITCTFTNTRKSAVFTLDKTWVSPVAGDVVNLLTATATNSISTTATAPAGAVAVNTMTVFAGETINFSEVAGLAATNLANYTTTWSCDGGATNTPGVSGTYTVPATPVAVTCTFTNTQNDTPVTLTKVWVGGITADAVSLAITGVTGSVAAVDGASIVDGAASDATATALVGDTVTLTEAFTTGDAGNYTKVLTCTSPTQLTAQEIAADALTGNYSVVVGDAGGPIACTFTNTQNDTPVTLTKVWVGGITADAVSLAITGVTGSVAAVDGASIVDGAASDATATALVGDTVTLTEAFTTGDAGNYTKVLTCTSPTQTAQVIAADALTGDYAVVVGDEGGPIACTFTNTQNDTPVTLTKVWVGGITADAVSLAITGVTGSVAAVDGASIVDGAASDATATALVGDTVTLTEAFTTGDAGNYTKVLTCTSPTQLTAQEIAADALTGNYSVVVGDAGGPIACTFTNTQNDTPVTLTKVWVGGITADAVSLAITGVTGSVAAVDGASIVDGAASDATATALVGDTVTLTEAFTTGDAGNYTKVLTCTSPTQLTAQEIAADALTGNYSVVVGDAGGPIACTFTNTQNDTPVTLTKVWVGGITADAVSLAITGVTGSVAAVDGASIVDGAASDATATALVGDTVTLTEAFTTGDAGNYTKVLTCTSPTQLTAQEIAADALTGNYSVVVGDAGGPIACTFTNTQNDTPVTLTKVWVGGITADAVSLAITGVTGSVAAVDGASIVDGAASDATATAFVGDTVTLTEAFTTGDAGNYTKVLTCTSPTQLTAQEIAADALTGNYSVVVGDAGGPIACTFTNTQNDTPVTLTKVWVGGITADAVSLAITGVTGSVAAVDGASIVDGAASDATATAFVGDTVTLTEAFTTGDAGNYTKVLTCTSPTQLTAQEIAADALTGNYSVVVGDAGGPIACTFTNTQNDTPVTLTKVWVGGITADAVSLAITGVTGSVAAVDGASIVDGAASDATATATALVGDTVTLTEAFTTGDAGNYTKVLTCTSPTQLTAQEIAADALTGNYSVVVGDAGGPIACTFTNTQNDTPVTLTKVWVGGITADAVSLAITGVTGSVAAVDGASIVDGAASDATATALVGDTVTLTEAFTTGDAGNYTKVLTCTSPTQLTAQEIAADALTGNYSVVVGDAGGPIACTFTNTQNDTPVTLTKVWVDGITADAVSLTITGASGMTTSGSSVVGTAVVMATADASVGDTVTLTEAFTTGDAGNYTKVLICTSPTQTAQVIAADALTGNYSVVVGDAGGPIACTFTNTQNDTPVTLTKVWVDGITADAVSLTITGASGMTTSGSSVVGTAVVMATADASVGDTVTLTEAFTTGDAGNYTKVLTCTSPTQTAQVIAADALTGDYAVVVGDEGGPIACTFTNTQNDTPVTLTKVWVGGITADAVSLAITGVTGSVAAVDGASIVDGAASDATATALVGDTVTLTEAFTTGDAGNYTKVLTCTSPTQLTAQEIAADALTGNYSVVVGDAGGPIACTFTNTQNDTPVTLTKVWVGGITADAVSLAITGVTGSVAAVDGASIVDGAASDATATALVGDTVTLTEAFTTGDAGNYTKVLTCTSPTQLTAQEIAADALTGNYSVVVGDAGGPIACTFTNTQNDTPVTLTKVWVGGITADAVSLAITGVTGSVAAVDGASIVDGAASDATATALVGDTVTLTEAFTTGDAGNYTKVLTCTSPTQLTAQEIAADALTGNYSVVVGDAGGPIACTFTNTQNDTPVTLTKVWVGGITADAVSLAITGVTGSVAAVDGASIVDGAASDATATALVGDTVTLTEAFTTGDAGNYTKVLTCTSPTQLTAQEIAADALTGNYSVVVGDAGGPIACTFTNTQNDTPVTLTKVWVDGIAADAVSLAITGVTGSVAAVDGASIVDGAASDATATATALVGDTVTLTEAFTTGDAGNYTKVLTCTSPTQLTAQVIAADALTGNYSVVVGDAGGPIACTFTNTQNDTPVTLTKVWVGGITADAVSLAITGVTGSVAAVDGASIVDGAASDATATALVGDTVTLTEAFTTGDAGNYTKVLTCTSPTQLTAQVIAADALTGNYSVVVGDAGGPIACTFTNTQNDTPVTLTKVWVDGIAADAVSLAITGVTGSVAAVDGASIVDGAASDATATATALVGDTVTLTEAFTTGDAGNYTKVLTCTSPTQTAQVIAADALTGNYSVVVGDAGGPIACTFTNTQNDTPVTLTKVWVDGITADAVSLAITGVTGSVAAVDGASIVDGAASDATATATALVGDTVTLTEAFTTGDAGNYTKVLTCTSPTQTAQVIAADALTGNYSVVVGDAGGPIACTFTNTQNDTPVTLTKLWINGNSGDVVELEILGGTGSVPKVDGSAMVGAQPMDATATATALAGDTLTFAEEFTTGIAENYTKTLTCTSPAIDGVLEVAENALTGQYIVKLGDIGGPIDCTFTNDFNLAELTLIKVVDIRFGYSLAQVSDFVLEANTDIDSQDSFSGLSGASSVTNVDVIAGIYNLDESEAVGSEGVLGRYEGVPTGWDCLADGNGTFTGSIEIVRDPLLPPPGDIMPGRGTGTLEINPGDDVVCTLINQETQPLPVSLTWVQVSDQTGPIVIEWETVTEVGNAGFALYYKSTDAEWLKIDNGVFVSTNGDGTTSQRYQYEVQADIQASSFAITEVNIRGQQKINGPYMLNQSIGKLSSAQPTDWEKIKQSNTRTRESKEKNKAELGERRMQKLNNRMSPVERQNKQKIHQGGKPMTLHKSKQNSWFAMLLGAVISSAHATDAETLLNFEVAEAGVVKVSHLQLIEQGIDLSGFVISRIGLTNRVGAIPVRVGGFSDETYFDENSYIEFVGEAYYSIYADKNIYTLTLGDEGSATQVINSDEAIPNGYSQYSYLEEVRHDPQQNYSYSSPDENDSWFAEKLYRDPNNENPSITIDLSVDHYAPRVFFPSTGGASQVPYQSAKISADMWGASTSLSSELDHLVHIGVNNNSVAVVAFDGFNKNNTQKQLSDSVIGNGNNQVTLAIPPNGQVFDRVNVDKVILNYPRRFVSRDGQSLFFQSSGQKFTVTGFTNPVTSIYRKGEDGSVEFLSNYNQRYCDTSYGCTVTFAGNGELAEYYVATSEDISSAAISDAPEQVDLLSGSAEYLIISHPLFIEEINNHAGYLTSLDSEYENVDVVSTDSIYAQYNGHIKDANAIRAYIKDAAALRGTNVILLVGADNYDYHNNLGYNAVSYLPSVYGKISQDQNHIPLDSLFADVNDDNLPDLQLGRLPVRTTDELHDLLIKRDSYQNRNYKEKALFVADMSDSNDFATEAEFDRNQFFQDWTVSTAYRDEASAEEVRDKIVNQINNGTSLVSYYGHSSRNRWSYGVFDSSDLPLLNNSNKPTIVTQWGCWNTYHVEPSEEALAVQLLLATDSGAVSVAGSVANTGAASVLLFAKYFSQKLFSNGGLKLGDAILQAKHTLANRKPNNRDVILGWQLLGFPELSIH